MLRETDETYHQMELEEYFEQDVKPDMIAVSKVFAAARKQMNLAEYKAFTLALCSIRWKDACPDVLYLDKRTVAKIIGISADSTDLSQHLKRAIGDLPRHSFLEFSSDDSDEWMNGVFISSIAFFKKRIRIRMNADFLGLFGNLDKNYITMWSGDIFKMHSERAVKFYELLRMNSDSRIDVNTGTMSIRKFKEMFGIPKDGKGSYMREKYGFDRSQFEKRVIDPICEDLSHTDMLRLVLQPNGKYYEKVKRGNRVIAYKFWWTITQHPRVADAGEVKQLQERVDKNPEVLKVAKDIVKGSSSKRRSTGSKKTNAFNEFEQNQYDFGELEHDILHLQGFEEEEQ